MTNPENYDQNPSTQTECPPFELGDNSRLIFPGEYDIEPHSGEPIPGTGQARGKRNQQSH